MILKIFTNSKLTERLFNAYKVEASFTLIMRMALWVCVVGGACLAQPSVCFSSRLASANRPSYIRRSVVNTANHLSIDRHSKTRTNSRKNVRIDIRKGKLRDYISFIFNLTNILIKSIYSLIGMGNNSNE